MLGLSDISVFPTFAFTISYLGMQGNFSNLILSAGKRKSRSWACSSYLALSQWSSGANCSGLQELTVLISSWVCIQWCHVGSLKLTVMWVFTSWKFANATNQGFKKKFWRASWRAHYCLLFFLTYTWKISATVQENFTKPLTHCEHKMTTQNELERDEFFTRAIIKREPGGRAFSVSYNLLLNNLLKLHQISINIWHQCTL